MKAGDPLPSLREVAMRLRIHPLTVDKAYKQLQSEGLIETNHGKGSCISANRMWSATFFSSPWPMRLPWWVMIWTQSL